MLRILLADKLPESPLSTLRSSGCEILMDPSLAKEALVQALAEFDPEVLVVRSTRVEKEHIEAAGRLGLIIRAGAGFNTIDLPTASSRGIYVANCPGKNATAVAELAWGHILNADRRIADGVADLRAGQWRKKHYAKAAGIYGRTLGVLGCGSIGREVIARGKAFGMKIVALDPWLTSEGAETLGVRMATDLADLARQSDVLTVHLALTAETRGMVNATVFEALPSGAIFVNTSRGEVVDEAALCTAIREKGIRAGLDVYHDEPGTDGEWSTELSGMEGVYGTHHIGASTSQAQEAVAHEACRILQIFDTTGEVVNCVNLDSLESRP